VSLGAPGFAVLGFRPHTYWTAVVALGGQADAPRVLDRRRLVFAAEAERFVYHRAAEGSAGEAASRIDGVRAATERNVAREIGRLLDELRQAGAATRLAVTPTSNAKPSDLQEILRTHSRIHAAEGSFYRDVVAAGCELAGLAVHRLAEREFAAAVCAHLGVDRPALETRLKAMGAELGPPWGEDYRLATLAAWTALDKPPH